MSIGSDGWPRVADDRIPEGERMIVDGFDGARSVPPENEEARLDGDDGAVPPADDGDGPGPGPEGCPVVPLGTQGQRFYYLTRLGQMVYLRPRDHTSLGIAGGLFEGDVSWLWRRFPMSKGSGKREQQIGWDCGLAAEWLMRQAAECGIVDVASEVRGLGTWADDEHPDKLIVHAGDSVLVDGQWRTPGRYGRYLYAGDRGIDRPGNTPLTPQQADELLKLIGSWRFRGGEISARIILGWLVGASLPGALDWRPSVWIAGAKETGKTTLLWLLARLLGSTALELAHLSEAGVRQALGINALAVLVDEFEVQDLGNIVSEVMRFVRVASSGRSGRVVKGGMDGAPVFTTLVGSFAFSSIYRPPLTPQDRQRLALVELDPLGTGGEARSGFQSDLTRLARLGPALRRRVIDQWSRFPELLAVYMAALEASGHDQRAREHYGTLLACADLVLTDQPPDPAGIQPYVDDLLIDTGDDDGDDAPDHEVWLRHLFQSPAPNWRNGEHRPIGRLVTDALALNVDDAVHSDLRAVGLKIEKDPKKLGDRTAPHLIVANTHPTLAKQFDGSRFAGVEWRQVLRRAPGAFAAGQVRFGGDYNGKATAVPIAVLPLDVSRFGMDGDRNTDRNTNQVGGAKT